jgi:hypothetical protein
MQRKCMTNSNSGNATLDVQQPAGLRAANKWARESGFTPCTLWRFRKRGWINTINIAGRQYISLEEIARFTARAAAGEFAAEPPVPSPATRTTRSRPA